MCGAGNTHVDERLDRVYKSQPSLLTDFAHAGLPWAFAGFEAATRKHKVGLSVPDALHDQQPITLQHDRAGSRAADSRAVSK